MTVATGLTTDCLSAIAVSGLLRTKGRSSVLNACGVRCSMLLVAMLYTTEQWTAVHDNVKLNIAEIDFVYYGCVATYN